MYGRNKYGARKTTVGGITYDSALEAKRGLELVLLERSGGIRNLKRQVRFDLVVNETLVCWIKADFTYERLDGTRVVEDVKGMVLPEFRIKAKLFKALYGFDIEIWPQRKKDDSKKVRKVRGRVSANSVKA